MNIDKKIKQFVAVLAVIVLGAGFGYGISRLNNNGDSSNANAILSTEEVNDTNCEYVCVDITEEGFVPGEIAVLVGQVVQFNSKDGKVHNLAVGRGTDHEAPEYVADDGHGHSHVDGTESGDFGADEGWRVEFKEIGSYIIHDHYNPDFSMLVVSYEVGGSKLE